MIQARHVQLKNIVNHELFCKTIPNLKKSGVLNNICKFLELVSHDIFPLYNIYFLLFHDTVNFFATENASGLRYRKKDYVILDVWALVFSWNMDKILQGWET